MNEIRDLANTPTTALHAAFVDAFADYAVDMQMPLEHFTELTTTRSFRAECSLGYFCGDRLAGFVLVGVRKIKGQEVWYDISTGVIRAQQKQGVGDSLLDALKQRMSAENIDRFILEVLVDNIPARELYEKHDFKISRRLNCYQAPRNSFNSEPLGGFQVDAPPRSLVGIDEIAFNSFTPSWQNGLAAFNSVPDKHCVRTISINGELVAYGIVHRERGRVLQVGVDPAFASTKLAEAIVTLLAESTHSEQLVFLNVEAETALEKTLKHLGFTSMLDQFEMEFRPKTKQRI